ncbi:MAG TPA: hypothetical protein VI729_05165 [Anaerolineales bacterium]|nr:hypothetical protein [Anaerolineales bacterium]
MTAAYDAISNATPGTGDLSWTHTPAGTPRGAIVYVIQQGGGTDEVSGVTYGGSAMVEAPASPIGKTGGEPDVVYAYTLLSSVPTGNQTVVVTVSGADPKAAVCITLTAAADLVVQDADNSINSTAIDDPSFTLSLGGLDCFCCLGYFSGRQTPSMITPLASWTNRYQDDYGVATAGVFTYDTIGTADVTAGYTSDTADDATIIGLAITETGGAPAGQPTQARTWGIPTGSGRRDRPGGHN